MIVSELFARRFILGSMCGLCRLNDGGNRNGIELIATDKWDETWSIVDVQKLGNSGWFARYFCNSYVK